MSKQVFQSVRYITVGEDDTGQRIDNFLINLLKKVPKTRVYRMIRKGEVRVNRKRIASGYRLEAGDEIRVPPVFEDEKEALPSPSRSLRECLLQSVLFEDERLIIINKPAGVPVHGGVRTPIGVIEAMRMIHPEWPQLELVHRLDLDTSGCLILAKKRSTLRELHALLREGGMHKVYRVLTAGHWKANEYRVDVALEKNHKVSGERIVQVRTEGKAALTVFRPVTVYKTASLMEAVLHTGRTHQIRVHARYRGHPVAGDEKYGDKAFNQKMREVGLKRMFLHAYHIEFTLESSGKAYSVTAPLEGELMDCLEHLPSSHSSTPSFHPRAGMERE